MRGIQLRLLLAGFLVVSLLACDREAPELPTESAAREKMLAEPRALREHAEAARRVAEDEALQARLQAMTPEERAAYEREQKLKALNARLERYFFTGMASQAAREAGFSPSPVQRLQQVEPQEDGAFLITWWIDQRLNTVSKIRAGAATDLYAVLRAVSDSGVEFSSFRLVGTRIMTDMYGADADKPMIQAVYKKETIDRIVWAGFMPENTLRIADELTMARISDADVRF